MVVIKKTRNFRKERSLWTVVLGAKFLASPLLQAPVTASLLGP